MSLNVAKEVAALGRMTVTQLRGRYAEVFGESTAANNKTWLVRRIAWRLQAQAEGDLSERAKGRAAELARDADLRLGPPPVKPTAIPAAASVVLDTQLPPPGTILTRPYKGGTIPLLRTSDM